MAKKSAQAKAAEQDAADVSADEAPPQEDAEQAPAARMMSLTAEEPADAEPSPEPEPEPAVGAQSVEVAAAPIESPERLRQRQPHMGLKESSNNPVASNVGLANYPGEEHVRLLDEAGNPVKLAEVFILPPDGSPSRLATVSKTLIEEFTYRNTSTKTTRLFYKAGAVVPIEEAYRLMNTYEYADPAEIPASEAG